MTDKQAIKEWTKINRPVGEALGYPSCCIQEFCNDAPQILARTSPNQSHFDRFKAAHIDGNYTGFIPCTKHAHEILSGKIKLSDLITGRNKGFLPFPLERGEI